MAIIKYDDASWHYGGEYPRGLDDSCASTHIGIFVAWCLCNKLGNRNFLRDEANGVDKIINRQITPGKYLIEYLDEVFSSDMISLNGRKFIKEYYESDRYIDDYSKVFSKYDSLYKVPDSWESYDIVAPYIVNAYKDSGLYSKISKIVDEKQIPAITIKDRIACYEEAKKLMAGKKIKDYPEAYEYGYSNLITNNIVFFRQNKALEKAIELADSYIAFLQEEHFESYFDMNITTVKLFYLRYLVYKESNKTTKEVAIYFFDYFSYTHYDQIDIYSADAEEFVWYVLQIADDMYDEYVDKDNIKALQMALESVRVVRRFESYININNNILRQWHIQALANLAYIGSVDRNHYLVESYVIANHYYSDDQHEFIQGKLELIKEYIDSEYGDSLLNKAIGFLKPNNSFVVDKRIEQLCNDNKDLFKSFQSNKGASKEELAQLEKELFITLPNEFKTFLSIYNGIKGMKEYRCLSTKEIVEYWEWLMIKNNYPSYYIPFAINYNEDVILYLNLEYFESDGIYTVHRFDYGEHLELAENFTNWLEESIQHKFITPKVLPTIPCFDHWNEYLDGEILFECEENMKQTLEKLEKEENQSKQIDILKQCVERFNELDEKYDGFIDTIYREDIGDVVENIADYYGVLKDNRFNFDNWRDW